MESLGVERLDRLRYAWRGDGFPPDLGDLVDTVRGDKVPGQVPRPEVGFGQRSVFLAAPDKAGT